jgi:hypothetical protein
VDYSGFALSEKASGGFGDGKDLELILLRKRGLVVDNLCLVDATGLRDFVQRP